MFSSHVLLRLPNLVIYPFINIGFQPLFFPQTFQPLLQPIMGYFGWEGGQVTNRGPMESSIVHIRDSGHGAGRRACVAVKMWTPDVKFPVDPMEKKSFLTTLWILIGLVTPARTSPGPRTGDKSPRDRTKRPLTRNDSESSGVFSSILCSCFIKWWYSWHALAWDAFV